MILLQRSGGRTRLDCRTNSKAAGEREKERVHLSNKERKEGGDGIELFCLGRNSFLFSLLSLGVCRTRNSREEEESESDTSIRKREEKEVSVCLSRGEGGDCQTQNGES